MSNQTVDTIKNAARIGILGGTFNPIHYGHLLFAENAREEYALDKILFMPSGNSYRKDTAAVADGNIRAHMVELAISDNRYFELSRMELDRPGATYTCDTIRELHQRYPDSRYFFLMGGDNLLSLRKWKDYFYILQNCVLLVAVRGENVSSQLREEAEKIKSEVKADIRFLPDKSYEISSSEIRCRVSENKSVRYLLPAGVEEYIREHALYQLEGEAK